MKALGVGVGACKWREIEVVRAPSGAPGVRLQGGAARLGQARGVTGWRLSLTPMPCAPPFHSTIIRMPTYVYQVINDDGSASACSSQCFYVCPLCPFVA